MRKQQLPEQFVCKPELLLHIPDFLGINMIKNIKKKSIDHILTLRCVYRNCLRLYSSRTVAIYSVRQLAST